MTTLETPSPTTPKRRSTLVNSRKFVLTIEHMEVNTSPSVTVPNETLTIKQILDKHVRGQKIADELYRAPVYNDGDLDSHDLEKVGLMDLAERDELREQNAREIEESKANLKRQQESIAAKNKSDKQQKSDKNQNSNSNESEGSPRPTKLAREGRGDKGGQKEPPLFSRESNEGDE